MRVKIYPNQLSGTVQAVASKSHAHRLLIASALSDDPAQVEIRTTSQDIETTMDCLSQLSEDIPVLNCNESGSTLRFMIPVAMALKDEAVFLGSGRLPQRPITPLKNEMEAHGCTFEMAAAESDSAGISEKNQAAGHAAGNTREICRIKGKLQSGVYTLPGNISSQYITGLLFALPLLSGDSSIVITTPLESGKYVDMTLDVLKQFNIDIKTEYNDGCPTYIVKGDQSYLSAGKTSAEGDWSNIAFWVVAGLISEGDGIVCTDLRPGSIQGDKAIAQLAEKMGGKVTWSSEKADGSASLTVAKDRLDAVEIDASEIPDLVPILSVAAATANGTTRIYNAGRLRIKESDRLAAMYDCLTRVGADITEEEEGLIIRGVPSLKGGTVDGYNDHRIVMAMAVASIVSESPIVIEGAEAINKSYPTFFEDFKALGGDCREL